MPAAEVGAFPWKSAVLWPIAFHVGLVIMTYDAIEHPLVMTLLTFVASGLVGGAVAGKRHSLGFVIVAAIWFPALLCAFDVYPRLELYRPYGYAFDIAYRRGLPWAAGFLIHTATLSAAAALGFLWKRLERN